MLKVVILNPKHSASNTSVYNLKSELWIKRLDKSSEFTNRKFIPNIKKRYDSSIPV